MVKNTKGGTGTKSIARKHQGGGDNGKLRYSQDALEQYACVTKMFGNGMCEIYTNDNVRLLAHIRNKFRGRQKRNNVIAANTMVLVGLRDWESTPKNCDILTIYDESQIEQLKNIPNIDISSVLKRRLCQEAKIGNIVSDNSELSLTKFETEESTAIIEQEDLKIAQCEQIDIDDI